MRGEDELDARTYFSTGGGFVCDEEEMDRNDREGPAPAAPPHPFASGGELVAAARGAGLTIAELMLANERALRPLEEVDAGLDAIHAAMEACVERGVRTDGVLPGGLNVKRRAKRGARRTARPRRARAFRPRSRPWTG